MPNSPESLVEEFCVEETLRNDESLNKSKLISFHFKPFTKKGDNYGSLVTSIVAKVKDESNQKIADEITYIAKVNTDSSSEASKSINNKLFVNEGHCLTKLTPRINKILSHCNKHPLRVPKCFYVSYKDNKEFLILEDLRKIGFQMLERKKPMDLQHTSLVLKELAKFHASSFVLEKKENKQLNELFPFLEKYAVSKDNLMYEMFRPLIYEQLQNSINILEELNERKECIEIFKNIQRNCMDIYVSQICDFTPQFRAVNHGDCWKNNILFR